MKLLEEENVFVLPGKIFKIENFIRIVICPPPEMLREAVDRIRQFCQRHHI
jgi:tyrosine aminotransferase